MVRYFNSQVVQMSKQLTAQIIRLNKLATDYYHKAQKLADGYATKHAKFKVNDLLWRRNNNHQKEYWRVTSVHGYATEESTAIRISIRARRVTKSGWRRGSENVLGDSSTFTKYGECK